MNRSLAGITSGFIAGAIIGLGVNPWFIGLLCPFLGFFYAKCNHSSSSFWIDHAFTTTVLAIPIGTFIHVVFLPDFIGKQESLDISFIVSDLSPIFLWSISGFIFGGSFSLLTPSTHEFSDWKSMDKPSQIESKDQIVVVGGGFAGYEAIRSLEEHFGPDPGVNLSLVSNSNALLFTPILPEVAGGSVEPTHISSPLRTNLRRTKLIQGSATDLDWETKKLTVQQSSSDQDFPSNQEDTNSPDRKPIFYDHLLLTLGSVPFYMGQESLREHSFDFKTLQDGMQIRNHIIQCMERANSERNSEIKDALTNFVIAGAGFAGAELAGAVNDLVRGMQIYFSEIQADDLRIIVIDPAERILPELSESLAHYSMKQMRKRGVSFKLETLVEDAEPGRVHLSSGETIQTETFIWTAGNRPHPLVNDSDLPTNDRNAVKVDSNLSVPNREGVWAAGDCASVIDAKTGDPHPPTAQHAVQQGKVLGRNVHATVKDRPLEEITYESKGQLCVIGYQTASAELRGWCFSGLFAWILWRIIYLSKLPGADRKIRVAFDWLIELFFPRDLVQTLNVTERELHSSED